jgi:hypothetical protein
MDELLMEISSGTVQTPDGDTHQVHGGAYLSAEGYLRTQAELERLRRQHAEAAASVALPVVMLGVGMIGLAVGYWLGRRPDDE